MYWFRAPKSTKSEASNTFLRCRCRTGTASFSSVLLVDSATGPAQIQEDENKPHLSMVRQNNLQSYLIHHTSHRLLASCERKEPTYWYWKSPQIALSTQASWHHRDSWDPLMSSLRSRINGLGKWPIGPRSNIASRGKHERQTPVLTV